jgi:hypothetical protein
MSVLLEHLYRVSLEEPQYWAMWFGLPLESDRLLDARIDHLCSYIYGLRHTLRLSGAASSDLDGFFEWLGTEKREFPCEGWPRKYLRDCAGDHIKAIGKFWSFIHEYLLRRRPDWFIRLNSEPLPSQICNGLGECQRSDVRLREHVEAINKRSPSRQCRKKVKGKRGRS